jgi:hypothetical protein
MLLTGSFTHPRRSAPPTPAHYTKTAFLTFLVPCGEEVQISTEYPGSGTFGNLHIKTPMATLQIHQCLQLISLNRLA